MSDYQLKYHQETFKLLQQEPIFSTARRHFLEKRQKKCNCELSESVIEWYSLVDAEYTLTEYSNTNRGIGLDYLGISDKSSRNVCDYAVTKKLLIAIECQAQCVWAVDLNGSDDPPVVVKEYGKSEWKPYADKFSTYVYTQVWDWRWLKVDWALGEDCVGFDAEVLQFLQENFTEGSRTFSFPGSVIYRFYDGSKQLSIVVGEQGGEEIADFTLYAGSEEDLLSLVKTLWAIPTFTMPDINLGKKEPKLFDLDEDLHNNESGEDY